MNTQKRDGKHESADLALAVYLEEVCDGRTVLWIGEGGEDAVDRLGRVARNVRVEPRGPTALPESVDVVVVPDLARAGLAEQGAVRALAKALGPDGALVAGAAVGGALDYERLHALTSAEFASVRMVGQSRFRGFSIVDFDATPEEHEHPTLDGSLVDADEAERFVALCAGSPARLDAYAVIRVPAPRRRRRRRGAPPAATDHRELANALDALSAAREHADDLASDLARRTTALEEMRERLERADEDQARAIAEIGERLDKERARVRELEQAVDAAEARADRVERSERSEPFYDPTDDISDLEARLADRGRVLAETERELDRCAILVRDLVEELSEAEGGTSAIGAPAVTVPAVASMGLTREPTGTGVATGDRERAVVRALEAEAARAEAQFAVDEVMGDLALARERIEALEAREADLGGRIRGLRARRAETEELVELATARQVLGEQDLAAAKRKNRELEAELAELREQLELEMLKARGPEPGFAEERDTFVRETVPDADEEVAALRASEAHLSERVADLSLQLTAAADLADERRSAPHDESLRDDLEAKELIASLTEERDHARAENIRLTVMVGSLEDRFAGARRGYALRIAELEHDLSMAHGADAEDTARVDALHGELSGLRARLLDREAALLSREAADLSVRDEADRLRVRSEELKERETELTVMLADAEELSELEANRANDMASTIAARDALVNRLQLDLANEERRARQTEEAADRYREEAERLREAVVEATERIGQNDALTARAADLEEALRDALTRAERHGGRMDAAEGLVREVRGVLAELASRLDEGAAVLGQTAMGIEAPDSAWNEPASAAPSAHEGEMARLRARLETLEREAADRETLLRSLTAQLEDRDERLRMLDKSAVRGDEDLRRSLVELQERAATLSENLANEKRARREAEAAASGKRSEELEKLHDTLGDRDAELLVLRGQVSSAERALKAFREAAAETRSGLEELLGVATAHGDPATAERVGGLLRALSRVK
jgi:hypothetical protein